MTKRWMLVSFLAAGANLFAGCAMTNPFLTAPNASGKPTVWDCAMVQMSSPPKYACTDNKTYTAFQLRDFRQGPEKVATK
ncbi:MAG TPA: hypothetical protein VJN94_15955 [Candidatus Binataceae bacterium]|nr:hypothetical protein [Candidatus Binataceae bacterium]